MRGRATFRVIEESSTDGDHAARAAGLIIAVATAAADASTAAISGPPSVQVLDVAAAEGEVASAPATAAQTTATAADRSAAVPSVAAEDILHLATADRDLAAIAAAAVLASASATDRGAAPAATVLGGIDAWNGCGPGGRAQSASAHGDIAAIASRGAEICSALGCASASANPRPRTTVLTATTLCLDAAGFDDDRPG